MFNLLFELTIIHRSRYLTLTSRVRFLRMSVQDLADQKLLVQVHFRRQIVNLKPSQISDFAAFYRCLANSDGEKHKLNMAFEDANAIERNIPQFNTCFFSQLAFYGRLGLFAASDKSARQSPPRFWPENVIEQQNLTR